MHPSPLIAVPVFNTIRGGMLEEEEVSQPGPLCSALLSSCRVSNFFSARPSSQQHVASIYSSSPAYSGQEISQPRVQDGASQPSSQRLASQHTKP